METAALTLSPLFRGLDDAEAARIVAALPVQRHAAGELIIREGEHGDVLYLIEDGLVEVFLTSGPGAESVLARLGPGEAFGEMSLLTGEPRSAGVRAVRDTVLRLADRQQFLKYSVEQPAILFNLSRVLVGRLSRASRAAARARDSELVAIVGPVPTVVGSLVAVNLAAALSQTTRRRTMLVDVEPTAACQLAGRGQMPSLRDVLQRADALSAPAIQADSARFKLISIPADESVSSAVRPLTVVEGVSWLRGAAHHVVINLTGENDDEVDMLLQYADRCYCLVPTSALSQSGVARISPRLRERMADGRALPIVLSGDGASPPELKEWVRQSLGTSARCVMPGIAQLLRDAARHAAPQCVSAPHLAFSRAVGWLARDVAKLKVGLAFGAGGARGFAHVGAIRLLEEMGIPNDYIAGSSMGSIIGAPRAMGMDVEQGMETLRRLHEKFTSLMRPSLSVMSGLLSPRGVEDALRELVGDALIEELPVPFAAVAADLESARPVVLTEGPAVDAMRASAAIPLIWPPKIIGKHCLVDGGVLNPVPTQAARDLGADVVIAVDLSGNHGDAPAHPVAQRNPNIIQNLMRCNDIMMADRAARDCLLADLVIRPRFAQVSWTHFDRFDEYLESGYAAAVETLPQLRQLLPWLAKA